MSEVLGGGGTSGDERIVELAAPEPVDIAEGAAIIEEAVQEPAKTVKIDTTLVTKLNLADYMNAVPVIRELRIRNETSQHYRSLTLSLSAEPAIFKPKTWNIDYLSANAFLQIPGLDVEVDSSLLTRLVESEYSKLSFKLTAAGASDAAPRVEVARHELTLEMLPRNQWGGLSHIPEMTAAFVQPNDPAIETLLKKACELLTKAGKSSSLDGYGSGSEHAWEIMSAIWNAVLAMGLDYTLPPASFELNGQKIRSPSHIAANGLATCMDTTMLFCAALEQAGLNPMAIFTEGHAFAGVWLKNEEFTTATVTDITALRKRIKLNELAVFETTLVAQQQKVSLRYAIDRGAQHLAEGLEEKFEMALDIRRARMQRIKPLASGEQVTASITATTPNQQSADEEQEFTGLMIEAPIALPTEAPVEIDAASLNPADRLARWQRKLLDLSLRNGLLNFRAGKKSLKMEAPDPGALEDILSSGKPIKLMPRPDLMDGADPRDKELYETREHANLRVQHASDALKRNEVYIAVAQNELDSRLVELYRGARTNMEEGGSNTLFLAVGFLSWSPTDREDVKYRAPLILIPVQLERKSIRTGFSMSLHTDEPRFNPTLIEMLRQDFGLHLGVSDSELPRDEAGLDIAEIWRKVSHAIRDIKGWEVVGDVVLSMFSFAKYLMWKDLIDRSDKLRENRVVRHLLDTPRDVYTGNAESGRFPEQKRLDSEFSPKQIFCPLPYDSSQLSAVLAGSQGQDMVLIGPPGTGKSQTIVNIIAQSIANNRRVLFVSEKIAALNVVHRRLHEVGLGDFCLEVHSNKASKVDVLSKLNQAWKASAEADPQAWAIEAERLENLRKGLNVYVEQLHEVYPNGLSIYKAIGSTISGEGLPLVDLSWPTHLMHNQATMQVLLELSDRLEVNAQSVGFKALATHPLAAICQVDWSPTWQQQVIQASREMLPVIDAVESAATRLIQSASLPEITQDAKGRNGLSLLAQALPTAAGQDWRFALRPDARQIASRLKHGCELVQQHQLLTATLPAPWSAATMTATQRCLELLSRHIQLMESLPILWPIQVIVALNQGLHLIAEIQSMEGAMSVPYTEAIEALNVDELLSEWLKAEETFWPKSALRKRAITKQLAQVSESDDKPAVLEDLQRWSSIRSLRQQVNSLAIPVETVTCWKGANTDPSGAAEELVRFQKAIANFQTDGRWVDEGFKRITAGEAGDVMQQALLALRELAKVKVEIADLGQHLSGATDGLWNGLSTRTDAMAAAIAFQQERRNITDKGALEETHDRVGAGGCGAKLQEQHKLLTQRAQVESSLKEYEDLRDLTGNMWAGLSTKVPIAMAAVRFQEMVAAALSNVGTTPESMMAVKDAVSKLLGDANAMLEPQGVLSQNCTQYLSALTILKSAKDKLSSVAVFSQDGINSTDALDLTEQRKACEAIIAQEHNMRDWSAWRKIREEAVAAGLKNLVDAMEANLLDPGTVRKVFETNYARWWLNTTVDHNPVIRGFVSAEHEQRIRDFRALDKRFNELTRNLLRARICSGLPGQDEVTKSSEWGILRHEISKKTRHKPLRELMSSIPQALTKLTPCMLMSPLSIAQYLPANAEQFDIVIFDEASQITVWDAIGAIARGRQVIMVGDPKQMPPTSFFDRAESAEDNEDVEPDLESILDECLSANMPTMNLNWHYRSRHESLIAFSNSRYYNGDLVTFPSPVTNDRAVSLHHVKGVYDRGGSRTNRIEAQALVDDLVARLRVEAGQEDKMSFGVVTFNGEQRRLIEDLLEAEIRKDPRLDCFLADNQYEKIFVKNLESVQGDERDVIYFSTTFGKNAAGHLTMHFGPMTLAGGERRLNVAVTRARHEMRVFASFKPEDIDLARTSSIGVRDMKHFLEFAERGSIAIAEANVGSLGGFDSPFEEQVARALGKKGWHVVTQVGVSSFRIDLGVIDPDAPGRYLAGVECDGATYHRSATARDRDMLREQVLRGLGWEILRIWSTDWWINPIGTAEKVHARLEEILAESRAKRAKLELSEELVSTVVEAEGNVVNPIEAAIELPPACETETDSERVGQYAHKVSIDPANAPVLAPVSYRKSNPLEAVAAADPDAFFNPEYEDVLSAMIAHVIHQEGPVLDSILAQRIARAHGWVRTGARILARVTEIAGRDHRLTLEADSAFYWPSHYETDGQVRFRRPDDADSFRTVDEISLPELESLARHMAESGTPSDGLVQGMAKEIGLQKVSAQSKARLELAMRALFKASDL